MKIALIGYGKMGKMIEKVATKRGHSIVARMSTNQWDLEDLKKADLCLEFTNPESVLENIKKIAELKKDLIIGTTGWHQNVESVQAIIEKNQIGALYSSNFSIGVQLLLRILNYSSQLINAFEDYDVAGVEFHHQQKKDCPSGTAIEITKIMEKNIKRIKKFPFSSIRCGSMPGTHTILFDSPCDTLSIQHEARNREGFAKGAVFAAEWLKGKQGLYTFEDCLKEILYNKQI